MWQFLQHSRGRIVLGLTAVVVVAFAAGGIYLFGGGGPTSHGPVTAPTLVPTKNGTIFTIDSSASEATFTIDEIHFGQPNTVVGKTNQVAGQILVDKQDPAKSQVGEIRVDLSTLATDNDFRNRELQSHILETGQASNQFATFVPAAPSGLPSTIAVGQTVAFQITGALTIHGVTRTVTFDTRVTAESATLLKGQTQATIKYKDYNISIPSVPSVTGVSDNVILALTFAAHA